MPRWGLQLLCSSGAGWGHAMLHAESIWVLPPLGALKTTRFRTQTVPCDGATATMAANRGAGFSKNGSILSNVFWQYSAIRNVFHSWSMCCKLATTFTGLCHSRILRSKHLTLSTPERKLKGSKWWQNGHVLCSIPETYRFDAYTIAPKQRIHGSWSKDFHWGPFCTLRHTYVSNCFNMFQWFSVSLCNVQGAAHLTGRHWRGLLFESLECSDPPDLSCWPQEPVSVVSVIKVPQLKHSNSMRTGSSGWFHITNFIVDMNSYEIIYFAWIHRPSMFLRMIWGKCFVTLIWG